MTRRMPRKEMFFSNLLNDIKREHLKPYFRYLLKVVSAVMNHDQVLDEKKQEKLLKELRRNIPVLVHNSPKKIYEVEKKIDEML